jgi:hypothetical protein
MGRITTPIPHTPFPLKRGKGDQRGLGDAILLSCLKKTQF